MITWLLALVLLSAADAITTPNGHHSSQAGPPPPPTAPPGPGLSEPGASSGRSPANRADPTVSQKVYTNQFVIQVQGGEHEARRLAEKHGFIYLNHILGDYYHLEHKRLARRSLGPPDMRQLDASIEEEPQVLKFERQVLKKRVKRDFIDLANQPTSLSGSLSNGAGRAHQQQQQQQQAATGGQRPIQMLRPNGPGRPALFMRPANQPPAGLANYPQPGATTPHTLQPDGRRLGGGGSHSLVQGLRLTTSQQQQQQQQLLDQLEMTSSGPPPFFLHANFSAAQQQQPNNINKQHRPPPPPPSPLQLDELRHPQGHNNQTAAAAQPKHANDTVRPAPFNDPSWPLMWYLDGGARNGFDLNVKEAWKMGYTGKGIVITILDDGLEKNHPDLQANYDPLASFDINGDDADPMPRYDANDSNRHGTRCAGEVAAVPNNNICSVGIAYNSKVGGVRMLDGDVTDAVEARSLGLNNQHIHIYSASWGPDDNGKTVDGPGELATRAFIEGVTNGRQGLGSIFVFASGNGGREHDNCNCDGYTNSIWTLSISSATENGFVPWYIEACSSTLATTYSSGSYDERQIATTDIRHSCTSNHTGTSASAPIAAGICALVLESNPRLTWRDMQHIVVRTAKPANLIAKDWRTNALGRNVSHAFGYGLMDAAAMIRTARHWTTVPMQYTCQVSSPLMEKFIPAKAHIELKLRAECANVRYLEHVQSKVTLSASRRGDLHIYLTSPSGTRSTLLAQRPNDQAEQGFRNWPFMTVHNWGESPNGVWTLEVHNDGKPQNRAFFKEWTLMLYGTNDDPNKHLDISTVNSPTPGASISISASTSTTTTPPPPPPPPQEIQTSMSPPTRAPSTSSRPATVEQGATSTSVGVTQSTSVTSSSSPPAPLPLPASTPDSASVTTVASVSSENLDQSQQLQAKKPHQINTSSQNISSSNNHQSSQGINLSPPAPVGDDGGALAGPSIAPDTISAMKPKFTWNSKELPNHAKPSKGPTQVAGPTRTDFDVVSAPNELARPNLEPGGNSFTPANNELDPSSTQAPSLKPPVDKMDENRQQSVSKQQQQELDVNQVDLKLTNYRSSGGLDRFAMMPLFVFDSNQKLQQPNGGSPTKRPDQSKQAADNGASSGQLQASSRFLVQVSLFAMVYMTMSLGIGHHLAPALPTG